MRYPFVAGLIVVFLAALAVGYSLSGKEKGPLVLAASSMQEALEAAADGWEEKGNPRPVLSFAGTPALARQIAAGAPADLFISADEKWMDEVAKNGLIRPETRASFLINRLVLVVPSSSDLKLTVQRGFPLAKALGDGRLAMADPDVVPAGRYGKQALISFGVWSSVADKIAQAENVRVALALVSQGEVPLGLVYASDAGADPGVRVAAFLPAASHEPVSYPLALLQTSAHRDAEAFRRYLLSEDAKVVFRHFGFGAP